ncbi:hypothetical protein [Blastococcus sp. TF02A-35]|uniref:hypothetical protein n=1 Tax=Blastococcus sp. TF02A-35 TaxID=2559612 RepID=UPI0010733F11|nr:hypothetical protein [Blastococcus sp. TF02A_35]TFV52494.1 hypothetical protein E4P43_05740 [Blastococcus sp. TF02A_35]
MKTQPTRKRTGSRAAPAEALAVAADEKFTREFLLQRARRESTPIRQDFVQAPRGGASRHGPLAAFVTGRDLRGLLAYLLAVGIISNGDRDDGWSTSLPIATWARALGLTRNATPASAATGVSKVFARLVDRKLIEKTRHGRERQIRVTLLREDGSGDPYVRPKGDTGNKFLQLPHAFWNEGWHEKLDLPATAMLLVALHAKPVFPMPTEHMPQWYGWSADTAERGLKTLQDVGLLTKSSRWVKDAVSPIGAKNLTEYRLTGSFERVPTSKPKPKRAMKDASASIAADDDTTSDTDTDPVTTKETAP